MKTPDISGQQTPARIPSAQLPAALPFAETEPDEETFGILYAAVQLSRSKALCSVKELRTELRKVYPDKAEQIEKALRLWANYAKKQS